MKKIKFVGMFLLLFLITFAYSFERVKFAVMADMHMALYGKNEMKMGAASTMIVKNTVEELNKIPDLDFVVVIGDLLLDGEPWNLDLIKSYLDNLKVPYYVCIGNHDYAPAGQAKTGKAYVGVSKQTLIWTFQGHGFKGPNGWWSTDPVPGLHIVGLDATRPTDWGAYFPEKELQWLDKDLYMNRGKYIIIFNHHNFIPWCDDDKPGGKFDKFVADNAKDAMKIFEKYYPSVQVVISGHRHIGLRYKTIKSIHYFVCPALVSYPNKYTIFTITPTKLMWETKWAPVADTIIEIAKKNLLGKPGEWWRPSFAPPGPEGDKKMLEFFLGPKGIRDKGSITLKPVTVTVGFKY